MLCGLLFSLAMPNFASAAASAYEAFDYSPAGSDLNGSSGGTGFAGPWVPGGYNASLFDNYDVAAGSLTFGSLVVSGNRVHSSAVNEIAGLTRPLSEALGADGTTRYISFLVRPEGTVGAGAFNGFFGLIFHRPDTFPGANPEPPELYVGKPGGGQVDQYVLENRGGSMQIPSGVLAQSGQTVLVVVRADFTAGTDKFTLYINPTPGCPEPSLGIVKEDIDGGTVTELTLYSSGEFSMDELRVGNTFADVTPALSVAYEGFDYSPAGSDLNGNNGGTGFAGPWVPGGYNASLFDNYDIAAGSLTFGSLQVSGNRVHSAAVGAIAGLTRPLSQCLGTPGTTRYISLLLRPEGILDGGIFNGFFGLILHRPDTFPGANPEPPELYVGKPGGDAIHEYVLENRGGSGQVASGVQVQIGQTALLVIKAEFTDGNDKFTLYMNPTPGCPEPSQGTVKEDIDGGMISELTLYSSGEFSMDEIRVGNTFADVTPALPTPAYEGFDYSPAGSDLNGNNGGTGFAGPWVPGGYNASLFDNYDIAAGSLTFGSLQVSGNRVHSSAVNAIAGLTRPLSQCLGTPGTTRYISLLLRPEGTLDGGIFNGFFGLILHRPEVFPGANPEPPELFVGKPGGGAVHEYVLENRGGSGQVASGVQVQIGQTALLVIKAEFTDGTDKFTLYMNPAPGCPEPSLGTVKEDIDGGMISELTIYSSGEFSMDEIRIGNSFADVTPVAPTTPLTINCPDNLVLECGQDNTAAIAAWLASATCSGGCGNCQVIHDFTGLSEGACGTATVKFTAIDCCEIATCTRTISVIWNFTGFFQPVENPPVYNRAKAGSGIPLKFSLGGDQGLDIFAPGYPASTPIACDLTSPSVPVQETVAAGSSHLTYNPNTGQYTFIWKTDKAWAGTCRELVLKLADGTSHSAYFNFTK